ncbi:MAG: apolipoprotein N-acyltransferase [Candidatus Marinamargulisbacteria bacterium]
MMSWGWPIMSAMAMAASYHYFPMGVWVSLVPLFFRSLRPTTLWVWGVTYMAILHAFLLALNDDTHVVIAIVLWLMATVYFSLFYGIGGWVLYKWTTGKKVWVWGLPLLWPWMEWVKSVGRFGNPNGNLAVGLAPWVEWLPIYNVVGPWAVGGLIVGINVLVYLFFCGYQWRFLAVLGTVIGAMMCIRGPEVALTSPFLASVIQSDISQYQKLNHRYWPELEDRYRRQLAMATGDIVVFPETILPTTLTKTPLFDVLQAHSNATRQSLLVGSFIDDGAFNGSVFIQPEHPPIMYRKQRLMPFGETLPFRPVLSAWVPSEWLFNDFQAGDVVIDMPFQHTFIRPLICLEGVYGEMMATPLNSVVAILANNAWFNGTSAGKKMRSFAMVHAATYQTPVMLSANGGESAIIDHRGHLQAVATANNEAVLTQWVSPTTGVSMYAKWPWLGVGVMACLWAAFKRWFWTESL